nr:hypothetical protein [Tanacetum cinerariifolium]
MESNFDFEEEIRFIDNLFYDNSSLRPPEELNAEIANLIVTSFPSSLIPVQDEPPDADFEPDAGEEIPVVMNDRDEIDENDDYFSFMFVIQIFLPYFICSKMFLSLLSAESEDTIFNPGISV